VKYEAETGKGRKSSGNQTFYKAFYISKINPLRGKSKKNNKKRGQEDEN